MPVKHNLQLLKEENSIRKYRDSTLISLVFFLTTAATAMAEGS